ncbi:MAG: hypothetical protein NT159_12735 [Proteobacteria bacterium]|nr:hypothetical protein [Pseudomonadota bacterium]
MQLQLAYDPAEDRLLLTMDLGERTIGFWLTRRFTELLWQALWQRAGASLDESASATAREMLLTMQQNEALRDHAVTQSPKLKLETTPILATTLKYGPGEANGHTLSLIDAEGCGEALMLDDTSLHALIRLLDECMANSEWHLDLWRPLSSIPGVSPASTALH